MLAFGAVERLAGWDADRQALWAYDIVIACLAVILLIDLLRGRWAEAVVADLVVDLGQQADTRTLRDELGRALGDRSLVLGYWLAEQGRYVDDAGLPVELPEPGAGRAVTPLARDGEPVAVLVHDEAVLEDRALVEAVASAARMAVSNARLQAEVRARVLELAASRRRIVDAADAQRRRLERELREGAERRLADVASLLAEARQDAHEPAALRSPRSRRSFGRRGAELHDFAQGIHPSALTEGGLGAALTELVSRAAMPVELELSVGRLDPAVEAAVYFLCSEALANAAKHAEATRMTIGVTQSGGRLVVAIADDGIGGADPAGRLRPARARRPDRGAGRQALHGEPAASRHSAPRRDSGRAAGLVDPRPGLGSGSFTGDRTSSDRAQRELAVEAPRVRETSPVPSIRPPL